jgi:hypothetical protein
LEGIASFRGGLIAAGAIDRFTLPVQARARSPCASRSIVILSNLEPIKPKRGRSLASGAIVT